MAIQMLPQPGQMQTPANVGNQMAARGGYDSLNATQKAWVDQLRNNPQEAQRRASQGGEFAKLALSMGQQKAPPPSGAPQQGDIRRPDGQTPTGTPAGSYADQQSRFAAARQNRVNTLPQQAPTQFKSRFDGSPLQQEMAAQNSGIQADQFKQTMMKRKGAPTADAAGSMGPKQIGQQIGGSQLSNYAQGMGAAENRFKMTRQMAPEQRGQVAGAAIDQMRTAAPAGIDQTRTAAPAQQNAFNQGLQQKFAKARPQQQPQPQQPLGQQLQQAPQEQPM